MNEDETIRGIEELIYELADCIERANKLKLIISLADYKDLVAIQKRLANKLIKLQQMGD